MNPSSICPECGYPLNGNEAACPECGAPLQTAQTNRPPKLQPDAAEEQPQQTVAISANNGDAVPVYYKFEKTDFAHYIYECGVIAWRSYTKRMFRFSGRATRREYWSAVFIYPLIASLFMIPAYILAILVAEAGSDDIALFLPIIAGIVFVICPFLAVGARRMHDGGSSGWWYIVPWVSFFKSLKRSDPYENQYGAPEPWNLDEE